jgi:uncharacterized protein YdeI (YjbR/CyaY-like superfamily)
VPADLAEALAAAGGPGDVRDPHSPEPARNLHRIETAKRADTRKRRIEQFVSMLARGETIYPQKQRLVHRPSFRPGYGATL